MASGSETDFTIDITGLSPEITYYVRAYATTAEGTTYGNEVSFATLAESDPVSDNSSNIYWIQTLNEDGYEILFSDFGEGGYNKSISQWSPSDGYEYEAYNLFDLPDVQKLVFLETQEDEQGDYYRQYIRSVDETIISSTDSSSLNVLYASGSRLFWVEDEENDTLEIIRSSNLDGSDITDLYAANMDIDYLAYNAAADQIFFYIGYGDYGIFKINGDGTGYQKIPVPDEENIYALTTAGDKLYWAQDVYFGSEQKSVIRSASLDGSNITDVFIPDENETAFDIYELVVDLPNEKIVFEVEENQHTASSHIASVNFDGSGLTTLYSLDATDGYLLSLAVSTGYPPGY